MRKLSDTYINDLNNAIDSTVDISQIYSSSVLITGATGLIGSFLVDMLMHANETNHANIDVYALARNRQKLEERFAYTNSSKLHFFTQDVCQNIDLYNDIDYIIHAAGDGYPLAFRDHPVETMTPAIIGTINTLNLAKEKHIKSYVYISSGEVYGSRISDDRPFTEADNYNAISMSPRSCYPVGKQAAEIICASYHSQYQVSAKVARLSHTYGAYTAANDNRASTQFIKSAQAGQDIILKSKGEAVRSYTYVADAASAILTILLKGNGGEAYNVSNPDSVVSIAQFATALAETARVNLRFEIPNEEEKKQESPISYAVLDSTKLQALGWKYRYTITDGLKSTLENL